MDPKMVAAHVNKGFGRTFIDEFGCGFRLF